MTETFFTDLKVGKIYEQRVLDLIRLGYIHTRVKNRY